MNRQTDPISENNDTNSFHTKKPKNHPANSLPANIQRLHLDNAGRIVVPAVFRKLMDLKPGDPVTISLENDSLRIHTIQTALQNARMLMRKKNKFGRSLVDELISERRTEVEQE